MILTLKAKTNQEAFDLVRAHLYAQEGAAISEATCEYIDYKSRRCAAGALLDADDETVRAWQDDMKRKVPRFGAERQPATAITNVHQVGLVDIGNVDLELLTALQCAHDDNFNWAGERFVGGNALRLAAHRFGLVN